MYFVELCELLGKQVSACNNPIVIHFPVIELKSDYSTYAPSVIHSSNKMRAFKVTYPCISI